MLLTEPEDHLLETDFDTSNTALLPVESQRSVSVKRHLIHPCVLVETFSFTWRNLQRMPRRMDECGYGYSMKPSIKSTILAK